MTARGQRRSQLIWLADPELMPLDERAVIPRDPLRVALRASVDLDRQRRTWARCEISCACVSRASAGELSHLLDLGDIVVRVLEVDLLDRDGEPRGDVRAA